MKYKIQIEPAGVSYESENNLLDDAILHNLPLEHSCKTGCCGACSAKVLSGEVENENGSLVSSGNILTCQSKARSDLVLVANYYPELIHIKKQTLPCKVSDIEYVTDDILIVKFRLPPTAKFDYLPGQYINLNFKGIKRSYSIAGTNSANSELEFHVRKVPDGKMSELLFGDLKVNQLMRMEGPYGTFFIRKSEKPLILLATGTGIAPIKSIVEELIKQGDRREVHIYWGMRYLHEFYYSELQTISNEHTNIFFNSVPSREENNLGFKGYVQDIVCDHFDSLEHYEVYACGSPNMIEDAKHKFKHKSLPQNSFHSDAFISSNQ